MHKSVSIKEDKINELLLNLEFNNIKAYYFTDHVRAKEKIISLISNKDLIGFGGSETIKEIGLLDEIINGSYNVLNRFDPMNSKEEKWEIQRRALLSDVFITGSNAITLNGKLINIDHSGNRVAGILFGPKKVFIVVGINKIVDSTEEGIMRAQYYAAPLNAKRAENDYHPPCLENGKCLDCSSQERICNCLVILKRQYKKDRITVFIIGEELGF
ncbi:MAG: hypothetical protein VR67_00575 [Peptococcaceae bacterium BRH_c8a]|nr:MAG: hypothetical protein VR67_00575 [Peptococcaceae bacterium BRH_c8a]